MSETQPPTPYGELIGILEGLPLLIRETRRRKLQTLREAGTDIGVAGSTVLRWEQAIPEQAAVTVEILRWVAT